MSLQQHPECFPPSELFGSLEPSAGVGIWRFDFATQTFVWSQGFRALFNLDRTDLPSFELVESLIHPEDRKNGDPRALFLRGDSLIDDEFRIIRRNGSLRWVSHKAQTFHDADMNPITAAGILRDVTRRVEALKARDLAKARFAVVKRTTLCFAWVTSATTRTTQARGWTEITGQTIEQSSGWGWLDCIHPADRERTRRAWLLSLEAKEPYSVKYRLHCRDDVMRWFIARGEPVFDGRGELVEWFGVSFDISDVKNVDEAFFSNLEKATPTGALVRAARALLDWSIHDLAKRSGVSVSSIRRLESEDANGARDHTTDRLTNALDLAGIEFRRIDTGGMFVRLRKGKRAASLEEASVGPRAQPGPSLMNM